MCNSDKDKKSDSGQDEVEKYSTQRKAMENKKDVEFPPNDD